MVHALPILYKKNTKQMIERLPLLETMVISDWAVLAVQPRRPVPRALARRGELARRSPRTRAVALVSSEVVRVAVISGCSPNRSDLFTTVKLAPLDKVKRFIWKTGRWGENSEYHPVHCSELRLTAILH
jgi:hypothetical protein